MKTSMNQSDIDREIDDLIQSNISVGVPINASWLTHAIIEKHPQVSGADVDFYQLCAFGHVRNTVRNCLRAWKGDSAETPEQLRLPGYDRLQKAYLIEREEEQVIVPIAECTYSELKAKIAEYRRMAEGCLTHADELERYLAGKIAGD